MWKFLAVSAAVAFCLAPRIVAQGAPVPQALREAQSAYLVNELGDVGRFDAVARELREWGRWKLLDTSNGVDILVVLAGAQAGVVGNVNPATGALVALPVNRVALVIRHPDSGEVLWNDTTGRIGAAGRLVDRLRDRLDPKKR
jgi:hypothetical protein